MMRRVIFLLMFLIPVAVACGSGDDETKLVPVITPTPPAASTPNAAPGEPAPPLAEFRVAVINMMSPVVVDTGNVVASETYDQRLDQLIEELKALKPDIVAINEWTNTKAHGNPAARLGKELKMEYQWVRANPWFPGNTRDQNDAIAEQIGFQEGELILSRHRILRAEPRWLPQRTSETEGRAVLHVIVQAPDPLGEVDVYITHLTGGGDRIRQAQAASVASFVKDSRGAGPVLFLGDLGDPPGSATVQPLIDAGLVDVVGAAPLFTCCRDAIVGEPAAPTQRTLQVLAGRWPPAEVTMFGDKPRPRPDGSPLYMSDQNGLFAVFPVRAKER